MAKGKSKNKKIEWTPFEEATMPLPSREELLSQGIPPHMVEKVQEDMLNQKYFLNSIYQVAVHPPQQALPGAPKFIHLSIKRLDKHPIRDWRHFQRIKNELVGPEHEAIEIFPAESRLADMANQYHLWVLADEEERIPTGFFDGRLVGNIPLDGGKQRPHEEGTEITFEGNK